MTKRYFTQQIVVRYSDIDYMGHVSNAVYYQYLQDAYVKFMYGLLEAPFSERISQITVKTVCEYVDQVRLGEVLNLRASVVRFGTRSFDIEYLLARRDNDEHLVARGLSTHVTFDYGNNVSIPLPDDLKAGVLAYQGSL
ncbi:acyl-CoA thioesterase [Burkholderia sp. JP2-270]|uniref:acyl-CoA thioesterase n=1 Tax=Burkholderia sp. JP2-270 TaxID=2217913 RepID=UPI000DA35ADD|nr:thioesterase family protein [Burkholderia sp. JP2-270]AWV02641.1 acyl-CoA thioesterase [Burkholderia sp. JP2-270]